MASATLLRRRRGERGQPLRQRRDFLALLGLADPDILRLGDAGTDQPGDFLRGQGILGGDEKGFDDGAELHGGAAP